MTPHFVLNADRTADGGPQTAALTLSLLLLLAACTGPQPTARNASDPDKSGPRTVRGYRIQVFTTPEQTAAHEKVEAALAWWRQLPAAERPSRLAGADGDLLVEVAWKQPYYRVRLGAFADRTEAQDALASVQEQFPDAFLVPDTVTISR